MVEYKLHCFINSSRNDSTESNKKRAFYEKKEKTKNENIKNIVNKTKLFILIIFYVKLQISICENPIITLKIQKGDNSIINKNFKNYISEVYINDANMTKIETSYNFIEDENTVKIILNSQITNCNKMFMDCKKILEINFSNFDASNITYLSETFKNCEKLISLNLSDWDISKVTQISSLFENCKELTSIELPDFTKSELNAINRVFSSCNKLESINLSRINTSKVTNMEYLFNSCGQLASLDLSNFDTSKVTNMAYLFSGCSKLTSLNLSNFETSKVTNMAYLFNSCGGLTFLDLFNFNTSNVTNMGNLFNGCGKLTSLDLSNFDTSKVTNMASLFSGCSKLTSLNISSFDTSKVTNMASLFNNCGGLTSLDLSSFDTSKVTNMANMFRSCNKLTSLNLSNFDTSNLIDCNHMFNDIQFKYLDLSSFNTSKVKNAEAMFLNCQQLISLDLSNFDTSQITNFKEFLKECRAMTYLDISNFNTSSCTNMDRMFSHCASLTSLDLTHFDTSKVTDMHKMFSECFIMTDLNISNFNTSKVEKMDYMFSNDYLLTSLDLSSFTMESAYNITYMFNNTPKLEFINLSNSKPNDDIKISNIFIGTPKNLVICAESDIISQQKIINCGIISCSDNWREYQNKINSDDNQCVNNCSMLNNKFEYLSKCVNTCPDSLYIDEYHLKCVDVCPSSTYTVDNKCEKCHPDCKTCNGPYNDTNSNCTSCLSSDKYLEDGNCIDNNILIKLYNKDKYIDIASLYNTTNNTLVYNIIKENLLPLYDPEKDFEVISEAVEDVVFQITTSKNQLKALYNTSLNNYSLSILDISNCEAILKEKYNLNENVDLILLKKEKQSSKPSEKEVQLEIYEPYSKTKLNLSFCENTNINIYVKADLSNEIKNSYEKLKSLGYDMFNIDDSFYQDICIEYTSEGNTDIILSDRINYLYNNDDTKCQPNCKLSKYSEELQYLNCSCDINEEVNNMNEKFSSKKVFESFFSVLKYSNYKVLKCYNLVFTKYLITKNIGGIIVFAFIIIYMLCFIIFIIKGINPLKNKLESKKEKENIYNNNNSNSINQNHINININIDVFKDIDKHLNIFNPPKRKSCNNYKINEIINDINDDIKDNINKNKNKDNSKKKFKKVKSQKKRKDQNNFR